jgi:hypothetical protein
MAGYGRYLKGMEPRLEEWRLDQAREALRCLRKGIEGWEKAGRLKIEDWEWERAAGRG